MGYPSIKHLLGIPLGNTSTTYLRPYWEESAEVRMYINSCLIKLSKHDICHTWSCQQCQESVQLQVLSGSPIFCIWSASSLDLHWQQRTHLLNCQSFGFVSSDSVSRQGYHQSLPQQDVVKVSGVNPQILYHTDRDVSYPCCNIESVCCEWHFLCLFSSF